MLKMVLFGWRGERAHTPYHLLLPRCLHTTFLSLLYYLPPLPTTTTRFYYRAAPRHTTLPIFYHYLPLYHHHHLPPPHPTRTPGGDVTFSERMIGGWWVLAWCLFVLRRALRRLFAFNAGRTPACAARRSAQTGARGVACRWRGNVAWRMAWRENAAAARRTRELDYPHWLACGSAFHCMHACLYHGISALPHLHHRQTALARARGFFFN